MGLRTVDNPPNPWRETHVDWLGAPPPTTVKVYHERAKEILSENRSPDLGFRWSLNPYRGCQHACAYCYARPSHEYWDFGAGTDFETRIVAKVNAADRLRARFLRRSWAGEHVVFSGNTDCYQPLEASLGLTRACLEVCEEFRNPVGLIAKAALVRRDAALLGRIARVAGAQVNLSIPFADKKMARLIEPGAPSPRARFAAIEALAAEGVPVGVAVAPIIPGLNDDQIVDVLERAAAAGATSAFRIMVRLSPGVEPVFVSRLRAAFPDRAEKVLNAIRLARGGALNESAFGARMTGTDSRWKTLDKLFTITCKRLQLNAYSEVETLNNLADRPSPFRRPQPQMDLFG